MDKRKTATIIGVARSKNGVDGWRFDPPDGFFTSCECEFPAGERNICLSLKEGKWARTSKEYKKE